MEAFLFLAEFEVCNVRFLLTGSCALAVLFNYIYFRILLPVVYGIFIAGEN